ncbi:Suppressor of cytokine signaling 7, partial [Ophiophagus hannah]
RPTPFFRRRFVRGPRAQPQQAQAVEVSLGPGSGGHSAVAILGLHHPRGLCPVLGGGGTNLELPEAVTPPIRPSKEASAPPVSHPPSPTLQKRGRGLQAQVESSDPLPKQETLYYFKQNRAGKGTLEPPAQAGDATPFQTYATQSSDPLPKQETRPSPFETNSPLPRQETIYTIPDQWLSSLFFKNLQCWSTHNFWWQAVPRVKLSSLLGCVKLASGVPCVFPLVLGCSFGGETGWGRLFAGSLHRWWKKLFRMGGGGVGPLRTDPPVPVAISWLRDFSPCFADGGPSGWCLGVPLTRIAEFSPRIPHVPEAGHHSQLGPKISEVPSNSILLLFCVEWYRASWLSGGSDSKEPKNATQPEGDQPQQIQAGERAPAPRFRPRYRRQSFVDTGGLEWGQNYKQWRGRKSWLACYPGWVDWTSQDSQPWGSLTNVGLCKEGSKTRM